MTNYEKNYHLACPYCQTKQYLFETKEFKSEKHSCVGCQRRLRRLTLQCSNGILK